MSPTNERGAPIEFQVVRQCKHKAPCPTPPDAEPVTRWRSQQTVAVTPPARWTRTLLARFVSDLCASAGITDPTLVVFRGGPDPGTVTVNGNGHTLSMALAFIPDAILGPWLLAHRDDGNLWTAVWRPQPRDVHGAVLAPLMSTKGGA
jgi:hypothetical protein